MTTALFAVIAVVSFTMHGTPRQIVGVRIDAACGAARSERERLAGPARFIFCAGVAAVMAAGGRAFLHARR